MEVLDTVYMSMQYISDFNPAPNYSDTLQALTCIVRLMGASNSDTCPFLLRKTIPISLMRQLARYNKVSFAMIHFLTCRHCKSILSETEERIIQKMFQQNKLQHILLFTHEMRLFQKTLKTFGIKYVFFKNMRSASDIPSYRRGASGSDIDILVHKSDAEVLLRIYRQRKYTLILYEPKEFNAINPRTHVSIDIHKTIAYPHYGDPLASDRGGIRQLNRLCLASETTYLSVELLLISKVVRFWSNDLVRELRQIQDVMEISLRYEKTMSWFYVRKTLTELGYYSRYVTMLLLAKKIFGYTKMPHLIQRKDIPLRLVFLVWLLAVDDVSYLEDFFFWRNRFSDRASRYYIQYLFMTFFSDTRYPIARVFRPRLLMACFRLVWKALWRRTEQGV